METLAKRQIFLDEIIKNLIRIFHPLIIYFNIAGYSLQCTNSHYTSLLTGIIKETVINCCYLFVLIINIGSHNYRCGFGHSFLG